MRALDFRFTKINIERFEKPLENLKIDTHIDITSVQEKDVELKSQEKVVEIDFKSFINYNPEIAKIEFKGKLVLALNKEISKELLELWKDKKIPESIRMDILNAIFQKTNLKALQLEEDLNLPIHLPIPRLSSSNSSNNQAPSK